MVNDSPYDRLPKLILGFHGCNKDVFEKVIYEHEHLKQSSNDYDWLGHGIYFWENGYDRALDWARAKYGEEARVIGAVINMGYCLNLIDVRGTRLLEPAYRTLVRNCEIEGRELPKNKLGRSKVDMLLRNLDCAVIEQVHYLNLLTGDEPFDSVRGVFVEGKPAFEGSSIAEKTHVQICVVNPNCIKGYFAPVTPIPGYRIP